MHRLVLLLMVSALNLAFARPASPLSIIRPATDIGISRRPSNGTLSPTALNLTTGSDSTPALNLTTVSDSMTALNPTRFGAMYARSVVDEQAMIEAEMKTSYPPNWNQFRTYYYRVPDSTIVLECSFPEMHEEMNGNAVLSLLKLAVEPFMYPVDAREPVAHIKPDWEEWYWKTEAEDGTITFFSISVPEEPPHLLLFGQMKYIILGVADLARSYPKFDIVCEARDVDPGGLPPNFPVIADPQLYWNP